MAQKIILGLCTSGSRLKLAVSAGSVSYAVQRKIFNQERVMFGLIRRALGRVGGDLRAVKVMCAARGPGRFTGIRIALTLAGTLQALAKTRLYTASVFEILALQAFEHEDFLRQRAGRQISRIAVLLHAFKDEYFCQFFRGGTGVKLPRPEAAPLWLTATEMEKFLSGQPGAFYAVADEEEYPGTYNLLPPMAARARSGISRVLAPYIIKAAMAYGKNTLKPLYLKPAKYEIEAKKAEGREL
ncbi:MAG: hypothetical protein A2234_09980 [Elusimicrobia bacterium RIFOXYA2_FULL_58_8]|nr:MAG: hypothetical protein A2234_09980 [Elusimicrobia bacterium RIFOXYA2_FULL_58_8]OGS13963.1 MAG: hypothetical protein A2285_02740 [Elusimicrobia bacterium RIFOXYA12_FULL_57_11]